MNTLETQSFTLAAEFVNPWPGTHIIAYISEMIRIVPFGRSVVCLKIVPQGVTEKCCATPKSVVTYMVATSNSVTLALLQSHATLYE